MSCKKCSNPVVKFIKLDPRAKIPTYAYDTDSGADIYALEDVFIRKGTVEIVSSGIAVELPPGYELQVRSKSGLASRGIQIANGIGTCDNSYTGKLCAILHNFACEEDELVDGFHNFVAFGKQFRAGDKIAQVVISPIQQAIFEEVNELSETARGDGGFGSTGK